MDDWDRDRNAGFLCSEQGLFQRVSRRVDGSNFPYSAGPSRGLGCCNALVIVQTYPG